ncbi:MAG TPA: hypothetical protein VFW65_39215 [Pseudonocardiaceae bacterium]|nr:hypothetical protein [Pseudonocardiaceae bacterium]
MNWFEHVIAALNTPLFTVGDDHVTWRNCSGSSPVAPVSRSPFVALFIGLCLVGLRSWRVPVREPAVVV